MRTAQKVEGVDADLRIPPLEAVCVILASFRLW